MARKKHAKRASLLKIVLFIFLFLIILYPFIEARRLTVDENTLSNNKLPKGLRNMRIVYLSDIHQGTFFSQTRVNDLVAQVNSYRPDLILLGGDYATNSNSAISFFQKLPAFHASIGVFGVLGNHDRSDPQSNFETLKSAMRNAGVTPLVNEVKQLRYHDSTFYVAGIDDYNNGHPDITGVASKVNGDEFVIFLTHTPDAFPEAFEAKDQKGNLHWFDIGLSGHTHGGQITLLSKPVIRNYTKVSDRYLTGWLQENRAHILVSNGVGTTVLPLRLFARPQIHIITLQ